MKLLVTGGLGFIGSNFVKLADHDITVIDKQTYASHDPGELPKSVKFIHADICSINKIAIPTDFDWIINFAAESHVDNALFDATPFWETNVKGTYELTLFALKHNIKLFHVSTDEVFGEWEGKDFIEASPYRPNNMYAVSKAASDQIVRAQNRSFGLEYIITNCGNNYGDGQHKEKFMPRVKSGKVSLHAEGTAIRDWIHVVDHCNAILMLIESSVINESFVISARQALTTLEVAQLANADYDFNGTRPGLDSAYKLNPQKLENLGWRPQLKLEDWL